MAAVLLSVPLFSFAQPPLIIVNGQLTELTDLKAISPENIERIDTEAVNETSVEKYGARANNGIIHVTLKYDEPARFEDGGIPFDDRVESLVKWGDEEPAARVSIRYTVTEDGRITPGEVLEATDRRLKRRVMSALNEYVKNPHWKPASRNGVPVATAHVLQVRLPKGKSMPRERYLIRL